MSKITFFVEAPTEWVPTAGRGQWLRNLFLAGSTPLVRHLAEHNVSLSVATSTLDAPTATSLRAIAAAGVPITLWAVLPDEQGYFYNLLNLAKANARTREILEWAKASNVPFERIGFDLEAPISALKDISSGHLTRGTKAILQYMLYIGRRHVQAAFERDIPTQGVSSEFYVFPKWLHPFLGGGLSAPKDKRTIVMAYASTMPNPLLGFKAMMLGSNGAIPAVGLLNGVKGQTPGRDFGGGMPKHLSVRDLALQLDAIERAKCAEAYIFAMNSVSCWAQYLQALNYVRDNLK